MAKRTTKSEGSSTKVLYTVLFAATLIVVAAILVSMQRQNDNLTAWATVKSTELNTFMKNCRSTGGEVDVRPGQPKITFICQYPDRQVEYTLEPGK